MDKKEWWWGYKHTSGTVHLKRYFAPIDIEEAEQSSFCDIIIKQFQASDRDDAIRIIGEKLNKI